MSLVERLRKVFRGKDDEIARLTRLNESLTEHNKLLAGNAREASEKCSRLTRENKRLQAVVTSVQGFADEVDPPDPPAEVEAAPDVAAA